MRPFVTTGLAAAAAAGLMLAVASPASAEETGHSATDAWVSQTTDLGKATAMAFFSDSAGRATGDADKSSTTYAAALLFDDQTGYTMDAWLERSHAGSDFAPVSSVHAMTDTSGTINTYGYYDGPGYLVKACFRFTSWAGAAVHCSPAL